MTKAQKLKQIQGIRHIVGEGLLPAAEDIDWLCGVAIEALEPPSKRLSGVDYDGLRSALYAWTGQTPRGKAGAMWVRYVNGLIKAGWTVNDICKVIEYKGGEWRDTKYEVYLTPKTLFSHKHFETYLMAANRVSAPKVKPASQRTYNPEED